MSFPHRRVPPPDSGSQGGTLALGSISSQRSRPAHWARYWLRDSDEQQEPLLQIGQFRGALSSDPNRDSRILELVGDANVVAWSTSEARQIRDDDGGDLR